jgi:hypothetical protein
MTKTIEKNQPITLYILQGGVWCYANCGFSFRSLCTSKEYSC